MDATRKKRLEMALEILRESRGAVIDQLTKGRDAPEIEVCDAENLEILLRWLRVDARPSFEALAADRLPLWLAVHQGLARRGGDVEGLQDRLEKLFGYPAAAHLWEAEILPARLEPYFPSWLDSLMQETELAWLGCGKNRLSFAFPSDFELFREPADEVGDEGDGDVGRLFPPGRGKADLTELAVFGPSGWPSSTTATAPTWSWSTRPTPGAWSSTARWSGPPTPRARCRPTRS